MSTPALVNAAALDELADVIGREKLARLIDRFVTALATALAADGREGAEFGREAHTLISMSGMLGCEALSQACRDVEQCAKQGVDLAAPLSKARSLRDGTVVELREQRARVDAA